MQYSNDIGVSPSFNCYSNHNTTSSAAAKVSREVNDDLASEFDFADEDFEFSVEFSGEKFSTKELALEGRILSPIFNTDLVTKDEVDHEDVIPLETLLPSDNEDTVSSMSSEAAEEPEDTSSRTFCVSWRHKSSGPGHVKKSRSTGSEESLSTRWKIKDMLSRSNSSGNETMFFLCPKRVEASCRKRLVKSVEGPKSAGIKSKTASPPSIHELFYVHKRGEHKEGKMKSYLPYRQDILGFKVHVKGNSNKKLPF